MDGRLLPWGDEPVTCERANYDENGPYNEDTGEGSGFGCFHKCCPSTWPVGHLRTSKGDSPYGVKDMAGNVSEIVLDCLDSTYYARCLAEGCVNPVNMETDGCTHSVRGKSTSAEGPDLDVIGRGSDRELGLRRGFRCATAL
jgi:formylglycine-generating enzyme required for sulfatase activity